MYDCCCCCCCCACCCASSLDRARRIIPKRPPTAAPMAAPSPALPPIAPPTAPSAAPPSPPSRAPPPRDCWGGGEYMGGGGDMATRGFAGSKPVCCTAQP